MYFCRKYCRQISNGIMMKVVVAYGGLGNVMFTYALVCAYRLKGIKSFLFVSDANLEHNGYELERVFPRTDQWRGLNGFQKSYYSLMQKIRNLHYKKRNFPHRILFFPFSDQHHDQAPVKFCPQVFANPCKNEYLIGLFQSYKYFDDYRETLLQEYQFDDSRLSDSTKQVAIKMQQCNSVSIHVRRGDYMNGYYYNLLGKVCDMDYYKRAVNEIKLRVDDPHFFIFSDDKEYVARNLVLDSATYVDFNSGKDSWQDMYLMSCCNHNIIANSTFSWWGAWLNTHKDKIVVAPPRWFNDMEHDDIIPPEWKRV